MTPSELRFHTAGTHGGFSYSPTLGVAQLAEVHEGQREDEGDPCQYEDPDGT